MKTNIRFTFLIAKLIQGILGFQGFQSLQGFHGFQAFATQPFQKHRSIIYCGLAANNTTCVHDTVVHFGNKVCFQN